MRFIQMEILAPRNLAILALLSFVVGCSSGPSTRTTPTTGSPLPAPDTTSATGAYEGGTDYRLGAQDLLEVTVFGVPELNRAVRVNSNGQISLPLIGGIQAGGKTIPELEKLIGESLEKGYLQNPQVTVFVKEFTSQRITLQGAFKNSGIFPLTGRTTLLQSVAIAGGFDELADPTRVVIFRQVEGKKMAAVFDMKSISAGTAEDPQVYGDDIVVVSASTGKSAFQNVLKSLPLAGLFFLL